MIYPFKLDYLGNNRFDAFYLCPHCGGTNVLLLITVFPIHNQCCDDCFERFQFSLYRPPIVEQVSTLF